MRVHIDFETRSVVDLNKAGARVYAEHEHTDAICLGMAIDFQPVKLIRPEHFRAFGERVRPIIESGALFVAHNAAFELTIWNETMTRRYGWPRLPHEQVRCTMAMAYALALPGSLENAGAAVGLDVKKDMEGRALMLRMSRPRKILEDGTPIWWSEPDKLERLYRYCMNDVEVERQLETRLLPLTDAEQELWNIDRRINERGIQLDWTLIERAIDIVKAAKKRLDDEMAQVTGGAVKTCSQVGKLLEWVQSRGVAAEALAKADITELFDSPDLPADVRRALELRREAGKSSTAKLESMLKGRCRDGRVRDTMQYHAANTGRWGGRRVQPQNLPRGSVKHTVVDQIIATIVSG